MPLVIMLRLIAYRFHNIAIESLKNCRYPKLIWSVSVDAAFTLTLSVNGPDMVLNSGIQHNTRIDENNGKYCYVDTQRVIIHS